MKNVVFCQQNQLLQRTKDSPAEVMSFVSSTGFEPIAFSGGCNQLARALNVYYGDDLLLE